MNIFSRIRIPKLGKNNFDLSFENKFTAQMGQLVPFLCQEVIPGDEFKINSSHLIRFNPLVAPMMHRVDSYVHYFFVPNRLIWSEWEDFITGGEDGLQQPEKPYITWRSIINSSRLHPYSVTSKYSLIGPGSLLDYLGYNYGLSKTDTELFYQTNDQDYDWLDQKMDILPLRAYQLIYNEYYRNQNTQSEISISKSSGGLLFDNYNTEVQDLLTLRYRNWGLDYFTSSLPFSQRGPETTVPVTANSLTYNPDGDTRIINKSGYSSPNYVLGAGSIADSDGYYHTAEGTTENGELNVAHLVNIDNTSNIKLDGANLSIRDLRRAERIQEWLERSARSGARYIEQIKGHFGVFSSDSRLQRPEYLGGGKQAIQVSAVDQTSATDINNGGTPLGTMAGKAISGGSSNGFKTKVAEEHGFIIGIMSVLPKGGYHQGLNRKFTRFDKLDYFWPEFQNIGDQEVKTKELYFAQSKTDNNIDVGFGYTPRYSEYKCNHDEVHGDFKSTLDFWHLNRKFANIPKLNGSFSTTENTIRQDIFAVNSDAEGNPVPNMMIDIYVSIKARRPMYYYDNPEL